MIKEKPEKKLDLLIIGGGAAGLTSALFAGRAKINTLLLENDIMGGQIRNSYDIGNYPGIKNISGEDLINIMTEQAEDSGATIDEFDEIVSVVLTETEKIIETKQYVYKPLAVIIASGSKHKRLPIPEETKFFGKGIHYCDLCDGFMYQGKKIIVVGGGDSAVESALYLSRYASSLTLIHRSSQLRANKINQEEILNLPNLTILWESKIIHGIGDTMLNAVEIQNIKTGEKSTLEMDGIFVYIGLLPQTSLFKEYINLNSMDYIDAGETTETNIAGVFAAGDVRFKQFRQLATAVGDGATAALMAEKFITQYKKNNI